MATKDQQVRKVVQGLGLGLLTLGVTQVPAGRTNLELAFSHAWRRWPHADEYPSIGRAPKPDHVFRIGVTKSERRRHSTIVWRRGAGFYSISIVHDGWTPEDAVDIVDDRPLHEWVSLATAFRERLERLTSADSAR